MSKIIFCGRIILLAVWANAWKIHGTRNFYHILAYVKNNELLV